MRGVFDDRLVIDAAIHLITSLLFKRLQCTLVAQLCLVVVLLVLKEHVAKIVKAVRVVLVKVDRILVSLDSLVEHVDGAIGDAEEKEDLCSLILQTLINLVQINVLVSHSILV